jgi:hypothetical protein
VAGIGHDEDHEIDLAVSLLQPDAASERLDVPQPGLDLTCASSPEHARHAVPRPAIAWDRERHLGSPHGAGWESLPEAFGEAELCGISRWIPVGVGLAGDAQANGRRSPGSLIEGQVSELASFDAPELGMGHARSGPSRSLTDPGVQSASEELRSERRPEALGDSSPVEGRLVPGRHAAQPASEPLPRGYVGRRATLRALRWLVGSL